MKRTVTLTDRMQTRWSDAPAQMTPKEIVARARRDGHEVSSTFDGTYYLHRSPSDSRGLVIGHLS